MDLVGFKMQPKLVSISILRLLSFNWLSRSHRFIQVRLSKCAKTGWIVLVPYITKPACYYLSFLKMISFGRSYYLGKLMNFDLSEVFKVFLIYNLEAYFRKIFALRFIRSVSGTLNTSKVYWQLSACISKSSSTHLQL